MNIMYNQESKQWITEQNQPSVSLKVQTARFRSSFGHIVKTWLFGKGSNAGKDGRKEDDQQQGGQTQFL